MRKEKTFTVETGRDAGKTFLIREMPVIQADRWAQRALFAMAKSGMDAQNLDLTSGMLGMAKFAFQAIGGIDPDVGGELLDELLTCAQIIPGGGIARPIVLDSDIEDVKTLYILRKEALMIHIDFLAQGSPSDSSN